MKKPEVLTAEQARNRVKVDNDEYYSLLTLCNEIIKSRCDKGLVDAEICVDKYHQNNIHHTMEQLRKLGYFVEIKVERNLRPSYLYITWVRNAMKSEL